MLYLRIVKLNSAFMIISFRSIQKWMRVHKVRRELKKDQALRERCIGYVTKVSGTSSFIHVADYTYKYIKEGKLP